MCFNFSIPRFQGLLSVLASHSWRGIVVDTGFTSSTAASMLKTSSGKDLSSARYLGEITTIGDPSLVVSVESALASMSSAKFDTGGSYS